MHAADCPPAWAVETELQRHPCTFYMTHFVSAPVVAHNLFQPVSHHLALTQLGQQNGSTIDVGSMQKANQSQGFLLQIFN